MPAAPGGYFLTTGPYAGGSSGVYMWDGEVLSLPASGTPRTALVTGLHRARGRENLIVYRSMMGVRTLTYAAGVEARIDSKGLVVALEDSAGARLVRAGR